MTNPRCAHERYSAHELVSGALDKCATCVDYIAPGRWTLSISNGTAFGVRAQVNDDWLLFRADAGTSAALHADMAWELLGWNAALSGNAKFAIAPHGSAICLCAELPLDDVANVPRRVQQACAGLKEATALLHGSPSCAGTSSEIVAAADLDPPALCRATPWTGIEREPGVVVIDLHVPGALRQAVVSTRPGGRIAASVDLNSGPADALSPACRMALASFLLRTNGVVRMARAVAAGETPRLEIVFADTADPIELAHGLATLSVACRVAAREAEVLARDDHLARAYLDQFGNAAEECSPPTSNHNRADG